MVTESTDLSTAKAIAIDMRKDTQGNDFVLEAGESVTATLHMKAPETMTEEQERNPYTYNNIYINNTLIDELEGTEDFFIHQDYTRVRLYIMADVPIKKVSSKDNTQGIKGIKFRLYGTSIYGTEIDKYVTSSANGDAIFKEIEVGDYILQEYEGNADWVEDHTEHRVKITRDKKVYIDDVLITKQQPGIITNEPRIHTDVEFTKRDISNNITIKGVKFKLSGISDYGNEILMYATSNETGVVKFADVEKGKYELIEVETNNNYILSHTKYKVVVDENGNYDIQKQIITNVSKTETVEDPATGQTQTITVQDEEITYESVYKNGNYYIYNEPYHSFYFVKKDAYNFDKLGGAKFRLYGCSNYGNVYNKTVTSVRETGYVTFDRLEAGTYVLKEITPPDANETTYVVDSADHVVEVTEKGKVTLDGSAIWPLSETDNQPYDWYNTRNKGQITITKKWVDNSTNEERQEPTVYISTKKPVESYTMAYFRTADENNSIIDYVTADEVTEFRRNTTLSETEVLSKPGVRRIDNDSGNNNVEYKIYGWVENGILYWWTKADVGVLPKNLDYYFCCETAIEDIDWNGMCINRYWYGAPGLEELSESASIGRLAFWNCSSLKQITVPTGVTSIGENAISMCSSLTEITIQEGVTSIGDRAFQFCSNLTEITIPKGVTSIGDYAFYRCSGITEITIPKGVTSIGEGAFHSCSNLTEITIPEGVTNIGNDIFSYCSSLTEIIIPKGVTSIGDGAFRGCSGITQITIPEGVASIGNDTFSKCSSLTQITIPETVTEIGEWAFRECNSLTEITIPQGVTSIGNYAFYGCSGITEITIPEGVTSIGEYVFQKCSNLTKITIPKGVTSIEIGAFHSCSNLTEIIIPEGVTSIGNHAFYRCSSLTTIKYRGTEQQFSAIRIGNYNQPFTNATKIYNYVDPES